MSRWFQKIVYTGNILVGVRLPPTPWKSRANTLACNPPRCRIFWPPRLTSPLNRCTNCTKAVTCIHRLYLAPPSYLEVVMLVPLTQPELLGLGEVPVGRSRPQESFIKRVAVHQELRLRTTHRHSHMMPQIVRDSVMERFHVHFRVHPRGIVQPDLVLPAARLQF